jgi:hypothetical protein
LVLLANKLVQSHAAAMVRALTANPDRRFRQGVPGMSGSAARHRLCRSSGRQRHIAEPQSMAMFAQALHFG